MGISQNAYEWNRDWAKTNWNIIIDRVDLQFYKYHIIQYHLWVMPDLWFLEYTDIVLCPRLKRCVMCMIQNSICWWACTSADPEVWSIPSLPLILAPLWLGRVVIVSVPSMGKRYLIANYLRWREILDLM